MPKKLGGKETMTGRERVQRFFAHEKPDRVPIGYDSNPDIDRRLKEALGLKPDDSLGLKEAIGDDFQWVGAPYTGPVLHEAVAGRQIEPEFGIRQMWIEHGQGGYWEYCDFPLKDADEEKVANWPMPLPEDYDYSAAIDLCRQAPDLAHHVGDPGLGDFLNKSGMLWSQEAVYLNVLIEDPAWQLFLDRRLDIQLEVTRRIIEAASGLIDFMWIGEDLGTQRGPVISLDVFRKQIRPRMQKLVDLAKSFDLPVIIHSCGSSSWAFDDFIEMGIDGVQTLQPEAEKMSPQYLKENYGDKLVFHGAISTAGPLSFGSPDEVRQNVRETLEAMMPGGGYALAPTHKIQDNSPTENVLAMYEAAHEFGYYQ
ncbi:MAG: uroporphyrinogen decarboxylase family protein [Candidatus Sumerlaeia bacterium]